MTAQTPRLTSADYRSEVLPDLAQPWWQTLPTDFHTLPDRFSGDFDSRWRIQGTAAVDSVARTGLATMAGAATLHSLLNLGSSREEKKQAAFYRPFLKESDPNAFFEPPTRQVAIHKKPVANYHFRPKDGQAHTLYFNSPFVPHNPALRARYLSHQRNRTAWAQYWRHDDGPRPTLVMIHGFVADPYWLNTRWLALPWFYKQGFDVLLYTLPYHGRRKSRSAPFSGAQFFSHGLAQLNETFAHAIHDLRLFMDHVRDQGSPALGVTGISLGGYTTSLLAALEDDLAFAIPNVPVTSLIDLIAGWFPVNMQLALYKKAYGTDMAGLREITALHSPLSWPCRVPHQNRMIIGGAGDRFAPPKHSHLLWQHWDECALHWFPGNHLLHLDQGLYLKAMRRFMIEALGDQAASLTPT